MIAEAATADYRAKVLAAYLDCALWAGLDWVEGEDSSEPLEKRFSVSDVSEETRAAVASELGDFLDDCASDLEGILPDQVGHDFYLTRNRHGAGFWDRGLGDVGDRLTAAAHVYGESELYAGDDGRLYA
jgi:hypothetical protein